MPPDDPPPALDYAAPKRRAPWWEPLTEAGREGVALVRDFARLLPVAAAALTVMASVIGALVAILYLVFR
ncbi:MAG TPA: hypothetical protein VF796_01500 [Humisphaera sp.]